MVVSPACISFDRGSHEEAPFPTACLVLLTSVVVAVSFPERTEVPAGSMHSSVGESLVGEMRMPSYSSFTGAARSALVSKTALTYEYYEHAAL